MSENQSNAKYRDSSSKIIFEDPTLCAQFLRGYLNIPLLKDVQPEDIEDVTSRYVHLFTEERNSDVVKRVHIKTKEHTAAKNIPFYLISLIEHKSNVDYNEVMQVFRYMVFIWKDYEKEMEKRPPDISKTKELKYPPILPIVFYDGSDNRTAPVSLHERVLLSDVLGEYIPNYRCILMQLKEYSNAELMKREDVLSVIMMLTEELWKEAPHMFSLSQCIYEDGLEEGKEQGIQYLINVVEEFGGTMEMAVQQLMKKYGLDETNAQEKVYLYW